MSSPHVKALLRSIAALPQPEKNVFAGMLPFSKLDLKPPHELGSMPKYVDQIKARLRQQFCGRKPVVLDVEQVFLRAHHRPHAPGEYLEGCHGCYVDKRTHEGKPIYRIFLRIERDVYPERMVLMPKKPKQHKRRRWMTLAQHNRIQKKWNKAVKGETEFSVAREINAWSFNMMTSVNFNKLLREGAFEQKYKTQYHNY